MHLFLADISNKLLILVLLIWAFPNSSQLVIDMSAKILTLSGSDELQRIHDKWLSQCRCTSNEDQLKSNKISLKILWGCFLINRATSFISIFVFLCRRICELIQPWKYGNKDGDVFGQDL